jgi:transcriptional regulator with XRE-family HTH domain
MAANQRHLIQRHTKPAIRVRLKAAAVRFGEQLKRWRVAQGWSQSTFQDWGQAIGVEYVHNSQWSMLENGRLLGPRPPVFYALEGMNTLLAAGCYGSVRDPDLRDSIRAADAVRHEDGTPWDAGDFYAAYLGLLEWPKPRGWLPEITDAEAAEYSAGFRDDVRRQAKAAGLSLGAAMAQLLAQAPKEQRDRLHDVMLGEDWTGAELMALRDGEGALAPRGWLDATFA